MGQPVPLDELLQGGGQFRRSPDSGGEREAGWTDLGGAAMDSTQAGVYGIAEALGIPGARRARMENQIAAQQTQEWANPQLGVASSWDEASGVGGVGRYIAGQAINTAPQIGATLGAAMIPGVGAYAAPALAYTFALGDTLQNQREAAGTTDLPSAAAAAIPYAATDLLTGGEGRLLRAVGKNALEDSAEGAINAGLRKLGASVVDAPGWKGKATRFATDTIGTGLEEAAGESFQEVMNQAARIGVDPGAGFADPDALERYKESAIAGGLLGGVMGGAAHPFGSRPANRAALGTPGNTGDVLNGTQASPGPAAAPAAAGLTPDMLGQPAAPTAPSVTPNMMQQPPAPPAPPAPPPTPEEARVQAQAEAKKAAAEKEATLRKEAAPFNLTKTKDLRTLSGLMDLRAEGLIDDDMYNRRAAEIGGVYDGDVKSFIKEIRDAAALEAKQAAAKAKPAAGAAKTAQPASTAAVAAPAAPVPQGPAAGTSVPTAGGAKVSGADQTAAVPGEPVQLTSTAAAPEAAVTTVKDGVKHTALPADPNLPRKKTAKQLKAENDAAAAAQAAIEQQAKAVEPSPEEVARRDRVRETLSRFKGKTIGEQVVAAVTAKNNVAVTDLQRERIYSMLALDTKGEPTGLPQRTLTQVAQIENDRRGGAEGEEVTPQAISKDLGKAGVDVGLLTNITSALNVRTADEVSTLTGKNELGETDTGDRATVLGQDESVDATESDAYKTRRTETNLREKTDVSSHAGEEQGYFNRVSDAVESMADPESGLNEQQRAAMSQLDVLAKSLAANPELTPDARRDALKERALAVLKDKALWPDKDVRAAVASQLEHGRTKAAKVRNEAARGAAAAAETADAALVAANEARIADNAADKAARDEDEELQAQWREQQMMSEEGREQLLREALHPEMHKHIYKAEESFDEDLYETDPLFADLDIDLQAQWVMAYAQSQMMLGGKPVMSAGKLISEQDRIRDAAVARGTPRNRYGQDQTTPTRIPGEGLPAAGVQAEATGSPGQATAPEPVAVQSPEGGDAAARLQEDVDRNAAGPQVADQEDQGGAADERGGGHVAAEPEVLGNVPIDQEYDDNTSWSAVIPHQTTEPQSSTDVMVGAANNYVPLKTIVRLARKYMSERQLAMPFQYSRMLGVAPRDWNKVMQALGRPTETPAFKRWFGQSKIVYPPLTEDDRKALARGPVSAAPVAAKYGVSLEGVEDPVAYIEGLVGEPRVMYHGTARDFTRFIAKQARAIFLSFQPKFADIYATRSAQWIADHPGEMPVETEAGPNVMPVYVKAENPFDYENPRHVSAVISWIANHGDRMDIPADKVEWFKAGNWTIIESAPFQEAIRARGFDGFYVLEDGVKNLAVYDSSQVKSAIGNSGEFNPESPNIHENIARATPTGAPPAGTTTVTGRQRAPSLKRLVRKARGLLEDGTITADQFAAQTSAALDAADNAEFDREGRPRQRGALMIRERLLAGQRRGELDADMVEFADWMLRQNPQWATDLGLSLKDAEAKGVPSGTAGFYEPAIRVITLVKGARTDDTAVHEVLHHLERMMPVPIRNAIRREWAKRLARAHKRAMKGQNENLKKYYQALMDYHYNEGGSEARKTAMDMLKSGDVPYSEYQHFNSSEFWAINGTDIMKARYGVSESILGRIRQWLSEFVQRAKGAFGLRSNASIINALNSLAQSDGQYRTGTMVSGEDGTHFMYAGPEALDQEKQAQLKVAETMDATGEDMDKIRSDTGWFKGLDDKWRYEFSDHKATLHPDFLTSNTYDPHGTQEARDRGTLRLGDILNHPELYKRYPEAANIKVRRDITMTPKDKGSFAKPTNVIEVNPAFSGSQALDTLVHEIQHWVQAKEGFAVGGDPRTVINRLKGKYLEREWQKVNAKLNIEGDLTDAQKRAMVLKHGDAYKIYRALAGEIEARDVTERRTLNEKAREVFTPYEATMASGDIAAEDVTPQFRPTLSLSASEDPEPGFQNIQKITRGMPAPVKTTATAAHDFAVGFGKGRVAPWLQAARFTRDILDSMIKGDPKSALAIAAKAYGTAMDAIATRRLGMQREVARIVDDFKKLPEDVRAVANRYMHDSTIRGEWGFEPNWLTDEDPDLKIKIDPDMAQRWEALGKLHPDVQGVIREAFKHQHDELMALRGAVERKADAAFDDPEKKQEFLDRFNKLAGINENAPYLPLKRFGNWAVVAKSPEYLAAEAELKAAQEANDDSKAAKARLKAAKLEMSQLETNDSAYRVSFRETRGSAEALAREWSADFGDNVDIANRDDGYSEGFASGVQTLGLISRMRTQSDNAEVSQNAKAAMAKLLTDFELSMLSELSVRQSERRRKGISGADPDMMRSFGTKGMSAANFIAAMESGGSAEKSLGAMKAAANAFGKQGDLTREQRTRYFNEISKRHYMGFDYKPSPVAEGILRASSIFQLVFNPAYHLVNALQPLTISAPWIGGKHGMMRTYAAFTNAYTELAPNITKIAKAIENNDYSGLPKDVQNVVRDLVDRGAISADQIFEHGRRKWKTDDPANPASKALRVTNDFMDNVGSTVELTNRISTAMVAYRLAIKDGQSEAQAREGAYRAIYETHGDYSGFNAPRMMRHPLARVITQYRKFQFIQLGLWGRMFRDAFLNSDLTKDEKRVARKQLAFSLGTMQAVGGLMAVPGAQAIGAVLKGIFGDDDDEPYSEPTEMKLRRIIGDPLVADLLLKGIPAATIGLDMSSKVGAGAILSPLPYAEIPHDRDTYSKALTAAMGPFIGGLLPKAVDGVGQFWQGNFLKGIENLSPNGIGNAVKGARYAFGEGVTSGKGDVVMRSEDVSMFDAAMTAVGFTTGKIADRQLIQESKYAADQFYKDRVGTIKRDYVRAQRSGDGEAMAQARLEWQQVQAARKARGYTPSPLSDLLKAPAAQAKKERSAIAGVIPAGKRDAGAIRQMEELTE